MRLLTTADLHYNHPKSRALADAVIDQMNTAGGDGVLVVGDTSIWEGDALEQCLSRIRLRPDAVKLFVAGNHELWTRDGDSYTLFKKSWPTRVRAMGWRWLESEPLTIGATAVVGTVGWYDYSFAVARLGIPRRFYEQKISPGAAERFTEYAPLFAKTDDIGPPGRAAIARWNDGRYVHLHRSDAAFLNELLAGLQSNLQAVSGAKRVLAATHHVPFKQLLPTGGHSQYEFACAFLGSEKIGQLLLQFPNVDTVICGHSHWRREADIDRADGSKIKAINLGAGYRWKTFETFEIE